MNLKRLFGDNLSLSKIVIVLIAIIGFIIFSDIIKFFSGNKISVYKSDIKDYADSLNKEYLIVKSRASTSITDAQIYYSIVNGITVESSVSPEPIKKVSELGIDLKPDNIAGSDIYEIKSDKNIDGIKKQKIFYDSNEKHFVTDTGEVFILPGFKTKENDETRWYINDVKYYVNDEPIRNIDGIVFDNLKITSDINGDTEAGTNLKKNTKLYISFDATLDGEKVIVNPPIPFEVNDNGTYSFKASLNGRVATKTVKVDNYKTQTPTGLLKVGDYIDFIPDNKTYSSSKDENGYSGVNLFTEEKSWRILYIDKETENFLITTDGGVNSGTFFSGANGFSNSVDCLNKVCMSLYSNSKLDLVARSLNIDDINKIFNKTEMDNPTRNAYYPRGTVVSGTTTFNNNEYNKTTNEWRTSRFYISDGGGIESTDSNGNEYWEAQADNPVYITETFYSYKVDSKVIGDIIGEKTWLASKCSYFSNNGVGFGVRTIDSNEVNADIIYDSYTNVSTKDCAIHPVVEINYEKYSIDTSDKTRNGSSSSNAWRILKDN